MTSPSPHRVAFGRRWILRMGLVVVGLVISVGATEVGLRLAGKEFLMRPDGLEFGYPDPEKMEDYFESHPDYLWTTKDYPQKVADALETKPFLVLSGCSCTEWGRFAKPLARKVKKTPGLLPLEYANLACSGWSSYSGLQQMKQDVVAIAPKVVTIYYGWNDHWVGFGVDDKTAGSLTTSPLLDRLLKHRDLRVVQLLTKLIVSSKSTDKSQRPYRVSLEDFRSNLEQMVEVARENGIQPVLITAPSSQVEGEEPEYLRERWITDLSDLIPLHQRYVEVVRSVAREKQAVLCDLAQIFADMPREQLLTFMMEDGIHFTPKGGERVAGILFRTLRDNDLLPKAEAGAATQDR